MANRNQLNFNVDPAVKTAWMAMLKPMGKRKGSTVATAALVAFLRMAEDERAKVLADVVAAEWTGEVAKLLPTAEPAKPAKKLKKS